MTLKLKTLSLSLVLIALLSAQLMQAKPQYHSLGEHSANGEGWAHAQPQRPHMHHHHHGYGQFGHGHNHNQFHDRYSPNYSAGPPLAPDQVHGIGEGGNAGQPGVGFGQTAPGYPAYPGYPGVGYGGQPSAGYGRQQPAAGYGGQAADWGYGSRRQQPGAGSSQSQGADWGYGSRRQQPGAGYGQSQGADWGSVGQSAAGFGNQPRPGYAGTPSLFQPRPTQPHTPYEPKEEDVQGGQPIQPRPQPVGHDTQQFNQQHGPGVNSLQPRPEVSTAEDHQSGNSIQPRPEQGSQGQFGFDQHLSETAGSPLQPRPAVGINTPFEFQELYNGTFGSTIQPVPTKSQLNFQTSDDETNHSVIQPVPAQDEHGTDAVLVQFGDLSANTTFQPRPSSSDPDNNPHSAVDDNIASIFNTQNFLSPTLHEGNHSHESRDPNSQTANAQPESVAERNLFDTIPLCPEGSEFRGGHCRRKA